jgi:hypothetical protein
MVLGIFHNCIPVFRVRSLRIFRLWLADLESTFSRGGIEGMLLFPSNVQCYKT